MRALNVGRLTLGAGIMKTHIFLDLWIGLVGVYSSVTDVELLGTFRILKLIYDYFKQHLVDTEKLLNRWVNEWMIHCMLENS